MNAEYDSNPGPGDIVRLLGDDSCHDAGDLANSPAAACPCTPRRPPLRDPRVEARKFRRACDRAVELATAGTKRHRDMLNAQAARMNPACCEVLGAAMCAHMEREAGLRPPIDWDASDNETISIGCRSENTLSPFRVISDAIAPSPADSDGPLYGATLSPTVIAPLNPPPDEPHDRTAFMYSVPDTGDDKEETDSEAEPMSGAVLRINDRHRAHDLLWSTLPRKAKAYFNSIQRLGDVILELPRKDVEVQAALRGAWHVDGRSNFKPSVKLVVVLKE